MKTIEQYKAAAVYFKPGRIVPNWLLKISKGDARQKRRITFGCPVWVLPCGDRHVIFGATELPGADLMRINGVKDVQVGPIGGMKNFFVVKGSEPVAASDVHSAIHKPIPNDEAINLWPRLKIKGTKLQRRRAKFAAKRATQAAKGERN